MSRTRIAAALLVALCLPAHAVNKCTDSAGKVSYQVTPCPKTERAQPLELKYGPPAAGAPAASWPRSAANTPLTIASAPGAPVLIVAPPPRRRGYVNPEGELCFNWYRGMLRDPRSAYWTDARRQGRVLTITIFGTNDNGGMSSRDASCEIDGEGLNDGWTRIHAQRGGWGR